MEIQEKELELIAKQTRIFFIINTTDSVKIKSFFEKEKLDVPLFFDIENTSFVRNKILAENKFHTFFLNENNEVVLVGSPIDNEKMWELYKDVIISDN